MTLAATATLSQPVSRSPRPVAIWLLACAGLTFLMVLIGGITRLTESGLSITQWKPISGILPPLDAAQWAAEFENYKQIPQYKLLNTGMTLAEFKGIFFWEYTHRLLGRLIGAVFVLPLAWFWITGRIGRALLPRLAGLFVLGGLQGLLGWYMVKSGLVDRVEVSQYRLAAHLLLAILLYGAMVWIAADLLRRHANPVRELSVPAAAARRLRLSALVVTGLVLVTILSGAFVAGTRAGLVNNEFPLMGGSLVPPDYWQMDPRSGHPWYLAFFENLSAVQFDHRLLAITTFVTILVMAGVIWRRHAPAALRTTAGWLVAAVFLQVALGLGTLLLVRPIPLAAAHQAGAVLTFTMALLHLHACQRAGNQWSVAPV